MNTVLIDLYWQVGEYVSDKVEKEKWGESVVRKLSDYLQEQQPDLQGFSAPNIWRMKQFYETYGKTKKLSTALRELPWAASPALVAEYQTRLPDKSVLQQKLHEFYKLASDKD